MFIGGLSWETTRDNLLRYFSQYGEVVDCVVMKNPETGRSRGFGFITFADPNNVGLVLQNTPHILDNRTVSLQYFFECICLHYLSGDYKLLCGLISFRGSATVKEIVEESNPSLWMKIQLFITYKLL